jgi:hypothetical protein
MLAHSGISVPVEQQGPPEGPAGQIVDEDDTTRGFIAGQLLNAEVQDRRKPAAPQDRNNRDQLARELADCYAKLNRARDAAYFYRIALQLQPSDNESKTQLRALQAQLDRQRANRKRQPVISENLEQDHPVKPRLTGAAGAQGGGQ